MSRVSKSIISIMLVFVLLFSSCSVVFAASDLGVKKQKNTIIVVPGLLGSELFSSKDQIVDSTYFEKGYRFWVPECLMPFIDQDAKLDLENLSEIQIKSIKRDLSLVACDENGKSKVEVMETNPIKDCRKNPDKRNFGTGNFYVKLINNLIKNTNENEYDIVFFSYDWRLSCGKTAKNLEKFINDNNYKNVTLISHSMGGLVCASYLSNPKNASKVNKTISLGSPFLGSPRAYSAIDYGKFIDGFLGFMSSPILRPIIKSVAENCPSIYELLPPKQYFDYFNEGYLNKPNNNVCLPPTNITTYKDTNRYILSKRKWPKSASKLLKDAQAFHNTLYTNGKFVLENKNIKLYNLMGFNSETVDQFNLLRTNSCIWPNEKYVNGDNLVSIKSALVGHALDNKDNYYINNVSHMALATDKFCISMVSNLVKGNTTLYNKDNNLVQRTRPSDIIQ